MSSDTNRISLPDWTLRDTAPGFAMRFGMANRAVRSSVESCAAVGLKLRRVHDGQAARNNT